MLNNNRRELSGTENWNKFHITNAKKWGKHNSKCIIFHHMAKCMSSKFLFGVILISLSSHSFCNFDFTISFFLLILFNVCFCMCAVTPCVIVMFDLHPAVTGHSNYKPRNEHASHTRVEIGINVFFFLFFFFLSINTTHAMNKQ